MFMCKTDTVPLCAITSFVQRLSCGETVIFAMRTFFQSICNMVVPCLACIRRKWRHVGQGKSESTAQKPLPTIPSNFF